MSTSSRIPPVVIVLRALWRMLDVRRRVALVALCSLLVVTAFMEMGGMIVLFGYVRGLEPHPTTGARRGHVAQFLRLFFPEPLSQIQFVVWGGLVVFGFMLLKNLQGTLVRFGITRFLMKINQRVSETLYRTYMMAPYEVFLERGFKRPVKEIGKLFNLFSSCFGSTVQLLSDSTMVLAVLVLLFYLDFNLALLSCLLFASVGLGLYSLLQKSLSTLGKEQDEADRVVGQYLKEGLEGLVEVRLRGTRNHFFKSYNRALGRSSVLLRRKQAMARLPRAVNELALGILIVGSTLYVTIDGQTIADALPTLGVFGFAGIRMNGVLSRINVAAQNLRRRAIQFEEAHEQLKAVAPTSVGLSGEGQLHYLSDEVSEDVGSRKFERQIELRDVRFKYPAAEKAVLNGVSLTIKKGDFVAFCGPSGGGKTTLLLLLMGMMKPQEGAVLCDGESVFTRLQSYHANIGYVRQSMYLVGRSIRDNVAFGLDPERVDDEKIWRALRLASLEEFVKGLPEQLDSRLLDAGSNVSGGQRQRLMIARALYGDPEIIVLDEATAALDNVTEKEVTSAITGLSGVKTIICVAHRLSTIQNSDQIYFLEQGKILAQGTYDELLATSSEFREMAHGKKELDKPEASRDMNKPTTIGEAG